MNQVKKAMVYEQYWRGQRQNQERSAKKLLKQSCCEVMSSETKIMTMGIKMRYQ